MSTTDSIVVDHAKIYVTKRVTAICVQLGIPIQPPIREKRNAESIKGFVRPSVTNCRAAHRRDFNCSVAEQF